MEEKRVRLFFHFISSIVARHMPSLANSGEIFDGGIDTKSMEKGEDEGEDPPICLESIWAKRVPNKQIRLSLITISQTGGAA